MSKKSSKTAHVLSLLSNPDKSSAEISEPDRAEISEPGSPAKAAQPPEPSNTAYVPGISIISDSDNENDALSEKIRQKLTQYYEPQKESEADLDAANPPQEYSNPEPVPKDDEPACDFIFLNLMEAIVRDKIIYFMREFGVCTCPRCMEDTIALTLNGLPPKYMVVAAYAKDSLVSYYATKYITQITVEATKACSAILNHPRH